MSLTPLLRVVVYAALFVVPILPLYVANESFFPFITGKGFAFRILVEIAFVGWLALALLDRSYRPRFSWMLALYGAFVSWMFIADLFAVNVHKAFWSNFERMDGFVTLIHVFLFFVIAGTVLAKGNLWRKWWWTFIGVSALICGYGLLQLGGGLAIHQSGVRLDATFGNSIYLAGYLLFAAAVTTWFALESKGWLRYLLIVLVALQTLILFNTATRGAIIAFVATAMLVTFLFMIRAGKRTRRTAGALLIALIATVGGFWLAKESAFVRESPILSRVASISLSELDVRFTLWSMAAEGIKERPITGYGQEGYNYVFNAYYRPELVAQEPWFDRAHSAYVDWLVAGGIPAFLLFLTLLLVAFIILFRAPNLTTSERIMLTGALAAYALQAIVVFDNLFSYIPLAAVLAYIHSRVARPIPALEKLPIVSGVLTEAVVVPLAGAALLFLVLTVNVPNMRGANHLVYAVSPLTGGPAENLERFREALGTGTFATQEIREQLVNQTAQVIPQPVVATAVKNDFASLAVSEMEKEVVRAPKDTRTHMQAALLYRSLGDHDRALMHIEVAETLSPNRQIVMFEHGALLAIMGRREEAIALFEKIYALTPVNDDLAIRTAAGFIAAGESKRAQELLSERFGTTVVDHDALVNAYVMAREYDHLILTLKLQAENRSDSPEARYRLASGYALAGRFAEARKEAQAAMARFPQTVEDGRAFLAGLPAGR